jgi:hypothetical protein
VRAGLGLIETVPKVATSTPLQVRVGIVLNGDVPGALFSRFPSVFPKPSTNFELQSKTMVTTEEHEELQFLLRMFRQYVYNSTRQKAQARAILAKNRTDKSKPPT